VDERLKKKLRTKRDRQGGKKRQLPQAGLKQRTIFWERAPKGKGEKFARTSEEKPKGTQFPIATRKRGNCLPPAQKKKKRGRKFHGREWALGIWKGGDPLERKG